VHTCKGMYGTFRAYNLIYLQPVVEAPLLDMAGHPVGLPIVLYQVFLEVCHSHKPTGHCLQQKSNI